MRPKLPPALMMDTAELEARFYDALRKADLEALMACWADDDDICCVHPGGTRLIGAQAIRASFEAIFARGAIPVQVDQPRRVVNASLAVHSVLECITVKGEEGGRTAWVMATNVYACTPKGWRMVAHHASPGLMEKPVDGDDAPPVLH